MKFLLIALVLIPSSVMANPFQDVYALYYDEGVIWVPDFTFSPTLYRQEGGGETGSTQFAISPVYYKYSTHSAFLGRLSMGTISIREKDYLSLSSEIIWSHKFENLVYELGIGAERWEEQRSFSKAITAILMPLNFKYLPWISMFGIRLSRLNNDGGSVSALSLDFRFHL